jgi:hypothetical protein
VITGFGGFTGAITTGVVLMGSTLGLAPNSLRNNFIIVARQSVKVGVVLTHLLQ